ncbi:MAG: GGDEF domain-containing protein [Armatimonadetes bacterium]|nr:GGDEF domain-containing protein [Armatimonadota bacterium]
MIWNLKKKAVREDSVPAEDSAAKPSASEKRDMKEMDAAIDTVGAALRALGRYSFDLEEIDARGVQEICEKWALHVLVKGARPRPGAEESARTEERRDWAGVRQFVNAHRKDEQRYVTKAMGDMRQVIWSFIHGLNEAFREDDLSDSEVQGRLKRLKAVVETNAIDQIKREAWSVITTINQAMDERRKRQDARIEELGAKLKALGSELQEARQESALDPLTRLYNRKALDEHLTRTMALCTFARQSACLLMIDIDRFKELNDSLGHTAGDAVLQKVADCMSRTFLRKSDFIARYGGDEFAVVLHDTTSESGRTLGERLAQSVRLLRLDPERDDLRITVSVGLSTLDPREESPDWLRRTDAALYRAKQNGRDRLAEAEEPS